MSFGGKLLTGLFVLAWAGCTFADERIRPQNPSQIEASKQKAVRVNGARASYVNFEALRRDFPAVRGFSNEQIEKWVLENFAYISTEQAKLNGIRHDTIPADPHQTKDQYRPAGYGRAGVMEGLVDGKPAGLVDVKGLGISPGAGGDQVEAFRQAKGDAAAINAIRSRDHSDGLMRHGEAVAELTRQAALQRVFDLYNHQYNTDYQTVESYFIIELPFDVIGRDGKRERASLYGRQAHWRGANNVTTPEGLYRDPHGMKQGTIFRSAVDFGGVLLDENPALASRFGVKPGGREDDPQDSLVWSWGHETAEGFQRGDSQAVYRHLAQMLEPLDEEWKKLPKAGEIGSGPQRDYFDKIKAVAGDLTPERTSLLHNALRGNEPSSALFATEMIRAAGPGTLKYLFAKSDVFRNWSWLPIVAGLPTFPNGESDPQLRAILEGLQLAVSREGVLSERASAAAMARELIRRHFAPEHQAQALAHYGKDFGDVEQKYFAQARHQLEKGSDTDRWVALMHLLRSGVEMPELPELLKNEIRKSTKDRKRFGLAGGLTELLLRQRPSPEYDQVLMELYRWCDYDWRLRIAQRLGGRRPPPAGAAEAIRSNMWDERGLVQFAAPLLAELYQLRDPSTKEWLLKTLRDRKTARESFGVLWEMVVALDIPPSELSPVVVDVLRSGSAPMGVAHLMADRLLRAGDTDVQPAVRDWLRGIGGLGRRSISKLDAANPWVAEQARAMGTVVSCRDAWNVVRSSTTWLLGGPILVGAGVMGYQLYRMDQADQEAARKRQEEKEKKEAGEKK